MNDYGESLGSYTSSFDFTKEMLKRDPTYGLNFDRIQWDSDQNCYVIIEYLRCKEDQYHQRKITPYSSHPNRYFHLNAQKFIGLWKIAQHFDALLYLVNYAKKGTMFDDEVLLMHVVSVNESSYPRVETTDTRMTRSKFSKWLREMNKHGNVSQKGGKTP